VALCAGLAPLNNNHFGRRALLRGRLRLYAITATALIEDGDLLREQRRLVVGSSKYRAEPELPLRDYRALQGSARGVSRALDKSHECLFAGELGCGLRADTDWSIRFRARHSRRRNLGPRPPNRQRLHSQCPCCPSGSSARVPKRLQVEDA
jgi:hypothetical protein